MGREFNVEMEKIGCVMEKDQKWLMPIIKSTSGALCIVRMNSLNPELFLSYRGFRGM